MLVRISPSNIAGRLIANPSKSHAQRAIAIAALTNGTSVLTHTGSSDDVKSAIRVVQSMGAMVEPHEDAIRITGGRPILSPAWDCGESGLCLRMFSAIAALHNIDIILTGHGTLVSRPVDFMAQTFQQLGVAFSSLTGLPPVRIRGPYARHQAILDGSISSQFLTGLLIALPLTDKESRVRVDHLVSKPYIDLTLSTLRDFGVDISHEGYETFHIPGGQNYQQVSFRIQGDWSGMAFMLVAGALVGEISVTGLPVPETQSDGRILEALSICGAIVQRETDRVIVRNQDLQAFDFDCMDCPDLFPPLVALAVHCKGISRIAGAHRLKTKESDRRKTMMQEFQKLGVRIWQEEDALCIQGGIIHGGLTESHNDHRIAMALAVAGLKAKSPVTIAGAECVAKSYTHFYNDLTSLGARVDIE